MRAAFIALTIALTMPLLTDANTKRSTAVRHAFVKEQACPSTNKHRLPCPGWIIDHVIPICAGGPDHVGNLQWQTVEDAKAKDREERRMCRTPSQ